MMRIFVDADACPVKEEVAKVAARHGLPVIYVSNAWMRLPHGEKIERVVVAEGPDVADEWIAGRATKGDIVVTQDIPLAARALKAGARAISNAGKPFTDASIGMALAMRELSQHLRETGNGGNYNASFSKANRSAFLQALEQAVHDIKRGR
ncbi:MAG TPA: YaiI/YqxD family protein [Hyphomicrobium sp.]|nr:YaiI/YqxD family protein [Hyphomicrobium sp.]